MRLRNNVAEARRAAGLSQDELSKASGVSRATLSYIEQDNGHEPIGSVMTAIAEALGRTDLFWMESDPEPATAEVA